MEELRKKLLEKEREIEKQKSEQKRELQRQKSDLEEEIRKELEQKLKLEIQQSLEEEMEEMKKEIEKPKPQKEKNQRASKTCKCIVLSQFKRLKLFESTNANKTADNGICTKMSYMNAVLRINILVLCVSPFQAALARKRVTALRTPVLSKGTASVYIRKRREI